MAVHWLLLISIAAGVSACALATNPMVNVSPATTVPAASSSPAELQGRQPATSPGSMCTTILLERNFNRLPDIKLCSSVFGGSVKWPLALFVGSKLITTISAVG